MDYAVQNTRYEVIYIIQHQAHTKKLHEMDYAVSCTH